LLLPCLVFDEGFDPLVIWLEGQRTDDSEVKVIGMQTAVVSRLDVDDCIFSSDLPDASGGSL
jgi:hypothetical protein